MSMFSGTKTAPEVKDEERDSVGGSYIWESDTYPVTIDLAYGGISQGGALSVNIVYKDKTGREITDTQWVQSGDTKDNKPTYTDKRSGEERKLPGLQHTDAICQMVAGKNLDEMDTEQKVAMIWDFGARAKVEQKVEMIMELIGAQVIVGVQKKVVDKNAKGDDGKYHPTGETRETNEVDKVFDGTTGRTLTEIRAEAAEAKFIHTWREKWSGNTINEATAAAGSTAKAGAPGAAPAPTKGLFE